MFKIILHGMVIQTKDNNNRNALESSAKMLLTYHCYAVMVQVPSKSSKFFMPKNSIEARWNSAMSWGGKDRTGVDPELL